MSLAVDAAVATGVGVADYVVCGGVADNGAFYFVWYEDANRIVHVYKSSTIDGTWAEEDSWTLSAGNNDTPNVSGLLENNTIHIMTQRAYDPGMDELIDVDHRRFDCTTDAWAAAETTLGSFAYLTGTVQEFQGLPIGWDEANGVLGVIVRDDMSKDMGIDFARYHFWTWTSGGGWVDRGVAGEVGTAVTNNLAGGFHHGTSRFHFFWEEGSSTEVSHTSWNTSFTRDTTQTGSVGVNIEMFVASPSAMAYEDGAADEMSVTLFVQGGGNDHARVWVTSEADPTVNITRPGWGFVPDDVAGSGLEFWNEADDQLNLISNDTSPTPDLWMRLKSTDGGATWDNEPGENIGDITNDPADFIRAQLFNAAVADMSRDVSGSTRIEWFYQDSGDDFRVVSFEIAGAAAVIPDLHMAQMQPA